MPFLEQARREAAARKQTLTALIEQGLRMVLAQSKPAGARHKLAVSRKRGGVVRCVDLSSNAALLEIMEEGLRVEKRR